MDASRGEKSIGSLTSQGPNVTSLNDNDIEALLEGGESDRAEFKESLKEAGHPEPVFTARDNFVFVEIRPVSG